jgi:hypothetical protein
MAFATIASSTRRRSLVIRGAREIGTYPYPPLRDARPEPAERWTWADGLPHPRPNDDRPLLGPWMLDLLRVGAGPASASTLELGGSRQI